MESNYFLIEAIKKLYSGTFSVTETGIYEEIEWLSEDIEKPTLEEIQAEVQRLEEEWEKTEYQRFRSKEYPPLEDFVDAYYWVQKGESTLMDEYISRCDEVKEKYPKS